MVRKLKACKGGIEFKEFEQLAKAFKKAADDKVVENFIREFLMEMALMAEQKMKNRTPADMKELANSWHAGNVKRRGKTYEVEIYNNAKDASFVEYGYSTKEEDISWVEGKFMMTISMKEIEKQLPGYLEKRQAGLLNQIMNGRAPKKG
ncbi:hypothetical protein OXPF_05990 [Oxobacter pfennigii]|uniref:HK97 gp10 family phage protein n=1 Tax=Oxobacter pfennigii TaxID=36849 RepID=A0A0P8X4W2_9CLOT|nr:HK97 gp10 family phage protein [Oxobacter pfennigii]KPU45810.1 hypothetical protein OXPF_05990 [Oxobacter pfennigii]